MTRFLLILTGAAFMATTAMAGPGRAHHRDIDASAPGLEREPLGRQLPTDPTASEEGDEETSESRRPSRADRPATAPSPNDDGPTLEYTENTLGDFVRARLGEGLRGQALAEAIATEHARRRGIEVTDDMRRNASRAAAKATAHHEKDAKPRGRR